MRRRMARAAGRLLGPLKPRLIDSLVSVMPPGRLLFACNICGSRNFVESRQDLTRENVSCSCCGSNARFRAVIDVLSEELFGHRLPLDEFPAEPGIVGVGLSDWPGYAVRLESLLGYRNTFLHTEPRLDVTDVTDEWRGRADFVISSDVFEHVKPPVSRAFNGLRALLKPGGLALLTVPYHEEGPSVEHYPDLHEYRFEERAGEHILVNVTRDGREQVFEQPVFHGGEGLVLEMREFGLDDVLRELDEAGFVDVKVHRGARPEIGVLWLEGHSYPVTARAPEGRLS